MNERRITVPPESVPLFDRDFYGSPHRAMRIGEGAIGGKAAGLAFIESVLSRFSSDTPIAGVEVTIPRFVVLATDLFDCFMERNDLHDLDFDDMPDDRIAHRFQQAVLPAEEVGSLRALIAAVRSPLAVRSSSRLEDAMFEPFAGVYATKMIPNNQHDVDSRFRKLVEAIKFCFASTFFRGAREYVALTGRSPAEEKMALIIQEVVGRRHDDRFYPHLSGVARSYNYYPVGRSRPEEGVVDLALGLGKTIVDGGICWTYSPKWPAVAPPVGSPAELLKLTQQSFWAVNMGPPPEYDPIRETEYLCTGTLADAEEDETLDKLVSTYDAPNDRLVMGTGRKGARVVTFAPILDGRVLPLNELVTRLLRLCEEKVGCEVEMEFAVTLGERSGDPMQFGFLQVRPMVVSHETVELADSELDGDRVLAASEKTMGNGAVDSLYDIVYVQPDNFEARHTPAIAAQLAEVNRQLQAEGRPYLLIGFGRWGSSDPWLGIPVEWGQISGARVIVEATLPEMNVEMSQGAHFFHNMTSFQVLYFSIRHDGPHRIDWAWLDGLPGTADSGQVRHVRLDRPVTVKVDGRSGKGVILR